MNEQEAETIKSQIEQHFPNLVADVGFEITSPESRSYNCIAWAVSGKRHDWKMGPDRNAKAWVPLASKSFYRRNFVVYHCCLWNRGLPGL